MSSGSVEKTHRAGSRHDVRRKGQRETSALPCYNLIAPFSLLKDKASANLAVRQSYVVGVPLAVLTRFVNKVRSAWLAKVTD